MIKNILAYLCCGQEMSANGNPWNLYINAVVENLVVAWPRV